MGLLKDTSFAKLFKHSLTGSVLGSVLMCLLSGGVQNDETMAVSLLQSLAQVPRFEMTMMCLSQQDKAKLSGAWDAAAANITGADMRAKLIALREKYGV